MTEKRDRSRSLSLDMKSSKRRCPSDSHSSLDSYYDDQSLTSTSEPDVAHVSGWRRNDLQTLGVYYKDQNSSVSDIFSLVEKHCDRQICDLPGITKLFINSTKDHFKLSLLDFPDFPKRVDMYRGMDLINVCSKEISSHVDDVLMKFSFRDHDDDVNTNRKLIMYLIWKTKLEEYINELKIIMHKLVNIEKIGEKDFQWLFMKFSEVFLMKPQPGDIFPREMSIKRKMVTSTTDIRYMCYPPTVLGSPCLIVMVSEDNKVLEKLGEAETDCVIDHLPESLLGQIGGQLLFENKYSAFFPGVLGLLCIGTKVIFMYCEMTKQHLQSLKTSGEPDGRSEILFTKAYDYMISDDRNEIIDYLFWIGYFQSSEDYDS